jgi:hypothetical protein
METESAARRENGGWAFVRSPLADALALLVKHVGEYGAHATAKRAGFSTHSISASLEKSLPVLSRVKYPYHKNAF